MYQSIVSIRNLKVSYRNSRKTTPIVRGFDAEIPQSGITGILGESGSGKTVSVRAILGLLDEDSMIIESGEAWFSGDNLLAMGSEEMRAVRGRKISYVFQDPARVLNPFKSVGRQIETMLRIHGYDNVEQKSLDAMMAAGLDDAKDLYDRRPGQLSGGQNQRIHIAMSIAMNPDLIIADEPTSSVDANLRKTILDLFLRLNIEKGTSIVVITHDFDVIHYMCRNLVVMYGGLVMESGDANEIMNRPNHPYTRELIRCTRSLNSEDTRLYSLDGRPPTPAEFQNSCPFLERCSESRSDCADGIPAIREYSGGSVRCLYPLSGSTT